MKKTMLMYCLKTRLLATVCLVVLTISTTNAQQQAYVKERHDTTKRRRVIVKVDPFFPLVTFLIGNNEQKIYSVSVEKFMKGRFSIQLTGTLLHYGQLPAENNNTYTLAPQFKYYFSKSGRHEGLFAGAFVKLERADQIYTSNVENDRFYANSCGGGVMAGMQYFISKRFVIESIIGIGEEKQYGYGFVNGQSSAKYTYQGFVPAGLLDVNIGYEF